MIFLFFSILSQKIPDNYHVLQNSHLIKIEINANIAKFPN
jgi:hypothetical protein